MPVLRSGLVIAGGYADKVRRVLFAQLKDSIKSGELTAQEVARAAGELNRLLFEILVNKLSVDKGDVVRITIEYEVVDGRVEWKLDTLNIQVWRRVPDEEVQTKVREAIGRAEEILAETPAYEVDVLGESDTGDIVVALRLGGRDAGAILVTPLDGQAVVRAAFLDPAPKILKRHMINIEGDLREAITRSLQELLENAQDAERRHAERVYREILALLGTEEETGEEEEEA